jgi:predicted negative regulator of RcsB-dependent stress response
MIPPIYYALKMLRGGIYHYRKPLAIFVLVASVGFLGYCAYQKSQRELRQEKEARAIEAQIDIDEKKTEVKATANSVNQSLANVNKVEAANFTNTNLQDAERARCKAFPNSKGC